MTTATWKSLGASGLKTPQLWLGTMMFGDQTSEADAASITDAARGAGVFAIDTADVYAGGESERIVGRLLKSDRDRWVLATKVAGPVGSDANDRGLSRRWITRAVDASLQRLDTDRIDLYDLHRDDAATPQDETLGALARLIDAGKVLHDGVSNFPAWRVQSLVDAARRLGVPPPVACQPPYSLVTRGIEAELLPGCAACGIGVVSYSPLARGVLSGKYRTDADAPAGSRAARNDPRLLQTELRRESIALAQDWAVHAAERGTTASRLAIAWVLRNRLVSGVIGGPRTPEQWDDYIAALDIAADDADERWVDARVPAGHASTWGYTDPNDPVTGRVVAPAGG